MSPSPAATSSADPAGPTASDERQPPRAGRSMAELARRALNVFVAAVAIVLVSPLLFVVALIVKLDSPGAAIYRQQRVGLDRRRRGGLEQDDVRRASDQGGRIFTIYKFRTMTAGNPGEQSWAGQDAHRITRVGGVLRATRLDELPQLFNVLLGDMNIVGPRPEQPRIFASLREEVSGYRDRQRVLPGITGWAQVNLGYDTSVEDVKKKVELDLEYIDRRSAKKDLLIMAKTMPVMVFRKGAM